MNLKKVFSGCLVLLLVLVISACGSDVFNAGSGKATELDLKEVKAFMDDKKPGFLYVKSALDVDKESDQMHLNKIEDVAKTEKIDFLVFDESELLETEFSEQNISKLTVKQYSKTFAFYQDGEMKEVLDFSDLSEEDVPNEVEQFVQKVKQDYLK